MAEQVAFGRDDYERLLVERNNWGRWGDDDEVGACNLITEDVRAAAAQLVQTGRVVALGRKFATEPSEVNRKPALHYVDPVHEIGDDARAATDYYAISFHGHATTHIDALCHNWDARGMWNGHDPEGVITMKGSSWAGIEHLAGGIVTRGVLLDVPRSRNGEPATSDAPVHGDELARIADEQGTPLQPGDALVVYSGREQWERNTGRLWGSVQPRPGLHESCLEFIRDVDCSVLVWDMMDNLPSAFGVPFPVHAALFYFGVALIDNAYLEELSQVAGELGRFEFMLNIAPLRVIGGTGGPVNPLAIF